ncbi:MAG TPA: hypothetical protein VLC09_02020 [Polyangiaceae bacterium]|nr:hypothetical protein [Polyangiaceae bacterium]
MALSNRRTWASQSALALGGRAVLCGTAWLGGAAVLGHTSTARADEPRHRAEPKVLHDTAIDLLDVADAFDVDDDFDLNLRLGFEHEERSAPIRRESAQPVMASGGYTSDLLDVATYNESTERLIPQIDIGLLPELALKVRMPVILANNRSLADRNGSAANSSNANVGLLGEQLFQVPFQSPTRSGIEYLAVGLDLGIMSQFRNPQQPNWVIGIEGRFNVSDPMHACNRSPAEGQVACAYPSDINRNGTADPLGPEYGPVAGASEGNFTGGRGPGVSRGTTGLEAHAYVSKRLAYIEPYSGVSALFEFPTGGSDFGSQDLKTVLANHPPVRGTVTVGLAVIPWEQPEKFQRISFDFRVRGTYVSEGRDYSELFDALGSSAAGSLRSANFAEYMPNLAPNGEPNPWVPSVVDPNSERVFFSGITGIQGHGDYDFRAQFTWQAGEYVKFDLGGTMRVIQAHDITFDQACTPTFPADATLAGPCKYQSGSTTNDNGDQVPEWQALGAPNPNFRQVINEPGRRYKVDTSFGFGGFIRASVMF